MVLFRSTWTWRIPGMAELGGLPSAESHRVGHGWSDLAAAAAEPSTFLYIHSVNFWEFDIKTSTKNFIIYYYYKIYLLKKNSNI